MFYMPYLRDIKELAEWKRHGFVNRKLWPLKWVGNERKSPWESTNPSSNKRPSKAQAPGGLPSFQLMQLSLCEAKQGMSTCETSVFLRTCHKWCLRKQLDFLVWEGVCRMVCLVQGRWCIWNSLGGALGVFLKAQSAIRAMKTKAQEKPGREVRGSFVSVS